MNSEQVQGTNDSSIVSKLSMVQRGYFEDDFIKSFVEKPSRRSPLINRCYHARAAAVSYCVEKFVTSDKDMKQIISLGAGFDTTYFRLKQKGYMKNIQYIEIDYPAVMKRKVALAKRANLILEDDELEHRTERELGFLIYKSEEYICLGYDLQLVGKRLHALLESVNVDFKKPTLFLSEVVLTYLPAKNSSLVLQWIAKNFYNAVVVVFEQVNPWNSFGKVMCKHFKQIGSPLLTIDEYPTIASQVERHCNLGLAYCNATSLDRFYYSCVPAEKRKLLENLEIFDEFEAWHEACQHYFILCSTNSESEKYKIFCKMLFEDANAIFKESLPAAVISLKPIYSVEPSVKRFGHSSSLIKVKKKDTGQEREFIIVIGGFGIPADSLAHQRLHNNVTAVDIATGKSYKCNETDQTMDGAGVFPFPMFGSSVACQHHEKSIILVFGGRASPLKCTNSLAFLVFSNEDLQEDCDWQYKVEVIDVKEGENWPAPRWRHATEIIPNNQMEKFMILFGGRDDRLIFDDMWVYDIESRKWNQLTLHGSGISPRHSHSVCATNDGNILLSGGIGDGNVIFADLYMIGIDTENLEASVQRIILYSLPPLFSHTSHCYGDLLILVGGVTSHINSKFGDERERGMITVLNLQNGKSSSYTVNDISNDIIMLHNHTSIFSVLQQTLFIVGGGDNCFSFGTWFNISPMQLIFDQSLEIH
uniref:tRNA wybutosine-synthesizing protein 4-like isoform X1 n=2 Tax=Styela clava TaxID=7725 RepID=UPI00193A4A52|nr:tRNA wybutosine-synthesizing protein 4-like isoform X1 [Styela clava]